MTPVVGVLALVGLLLVTPVVALAAVMLLVAGVHLVCCVWGWGR